jgi:hypothetical protein
MQNGFPIIPIHSLKSSSRVLIEIFRWCMNSEDEDQSRMHFALITAIERAGKGAALQVIPHVMTLIQELRVKKEQAAALLSSNGAIGFSHVDISVDRLFQLIQMLVSSECLDSNEIRMLIIPLFDNLIGLYVSCD